MWFYKEDVTNPVITSEKQVSSKHAEAKLAKLPKTAVLLYMSGFDYIKRRYKIELITDKFPRFLNACPIYKRIGDDKVCFLDGGRGAPMAADTIEVLKAFGVENVISIGLMGGFAGTTRAGEIIIPNKAYVEEGTTLHYYEHLEYSTPNYDLQSAMMTALSHYKVAPIVSTDAIYRQTLYKERLWKEKGCVGVDMETSALFSVGRYLHMRVASVLMVSDVHPIDEKHDAWEWHLSDELRKQFLYKVFEIALSI